MKKYFILILLNLDQIGWSQNLIPNGDFEQFYGCPTDASQLDSALFWVSPTTNINNVSGTPNYFNTCGIANAGVPNNFFGFQQPHSGNGYAGIGVWSQIFMNFREYIEVPLVSPLLSNECYRLQLYVNLANNGQYTIDTLSCFFSDTLVSGINNYYPLPFNPQINCSANNLIDSFNWTLITGDYTALGGESYLIIGNFDNDSNTITALVYGGSPLHDCGVNIDDVSLTPCNVGMHENDNNDAINIYPNPVTDQLNIKVSSSQLSQFTLFDITSRKLLEQSFVGSASINTTSLAKGVYLYQVINYNGLIKTGKIVKE